MIIKHVNNTFVNKILLKEDTKILSYIHYDLFNNKYDFKNFMYDVCDKYITTLNNDFTNYNNYIYIRLIKSNDYKKGYSKKLLNELYKTYPNSFICLLAVELYNEFDLNKLSTIYNKLNFTEFYKDKKKNTIYFYKKN